MSKPRTSAARRQAAHRQRLEAAGLVQVLLTVPFDVVADFKLAAERCAADRDLTIGQFRSLSRGCFRKFQ